jgi:flagellar basal body-associated protein FliL
MGLGKALLKIILIPIALILILVIGTFLFFKLRQSRKRERKELEQFQPPPISHWGAPPQAIASPMHHPPPAIYTPNRYGDIEHGRA